MATLANKFELFENRVVEIVKEPLNFFASRFWGSPVPIPTMKASRDSKTDNNILPAYYGDGVSINRTEKNGGSTIENECVIRKIAHSVISSELAKRVLGTTQFDYLSPEQKMSMVYMDLVQKQKKAIARAVEYMAFEIAVTGQISAVGYGVNKIITANRPATLDIVLAGANQWVVNGTVDIPEQVAKWIQVFREETGEVPTQMFMNEVTAEKYRTNTVIKSLTQLYTQSTVGVSMFDIKDLQKSGIIYMGTLHNSIDVLSVSRKADVEAGGVLTPVKFVADNKVVLMSQDAASKYAVLHGGTPEEDLIRQTGLLKSATTNKYVREASTNNVSILWAEGTDLPSLNMGTISALTPNVTENAISMTITVA